MGLYGVKRVTVNFNPLQEVLQFLRSPFAKLFYAYLPVLDNQTAAVSIVGLKGSSPLEDGETSKTSHKKDDKNNDHFCLAMHFHALC